MFDLLFRALGGAPVDLLDVRIRALLALLTAFLVALVFGRPFIAFQRRRSVHEDVEKGDSARLKLLHAHKAGTPTMGGVILLVGLIVAVGIWARASATGVWLLVATTFAFGLVGFADDWIKLRSRTKSGLSPRGKLAWQLGIGCLLGLALWIWPVEVEYEHAEAATGTSILFPFFRTWCVPLGIGYVLFSMLVVTSASNAVNLTDGLDGLAAGCSVLAAITLSALSLIAGDLGASRLLELPFISGAGEVAVFGAALGGAGLGFLWFNCHPARVFMGDTGSLALGAALGAMALLAKQELLLVLAGGVLVAEALSVVLQVSSYKLRGKRIFLIAPLHHHFQFKGWKETRVTVSFWMAGALCAVASLATLKLR